MKKKKIELWRIHNHITGYGILTEPKHDVEETVCNFCTENNYKYCFHKLSYEEEPYVDGRYVESGPWFPSNEIKKSTDGWKFGDYVKYVTIYYEEND